MSSSKRCKEDEALLNAYVIAGKKAYIVDTRTFPPGRNMKGKCDTDLRVLTTSLYCFHIQFNDSPIQCWSNSMLFTILCWSQSSASRDLYKDINKYNSQR